MAEIKPIPPRKLMRRVGLNEMDRIERENIRRRRGRGEQYKHQYLLTDVLPEVSDGERTKET